MKKWTSDSGDETKAFGQRKAVEASYVLEVDIGVRGIVNGAIDGGYVIALLAKVDEAGVRVDERVGGES